jgi:hypothetical protein
MNRDDTGRRRALREANAVLMRGRGRPAPLTLIEWLGVVVLFAWAVALTVAELPPPPP